MEWWLQASGINGVKEFFSFSSAEVFNPEKQPRKGLKTSLEYFDKLFGVKASYSMKGSMSKNHTEAQIAFLRGEAAMIINASWLEREMKEDIPEGTEIRMMRFPTIKEAQKDESGKTISVAYSPFPDYMIIPKVAENKEGAKKFLVYFSQDSMLQYFFKYTGTLTPFDYTPDTQTVSQFSKDCVDIWSTSETYFDLPTGDLKYVVKKFVSTQPYTQLIYGVDGGGTTVSRWLNQEYQVAKDNWSYWQEQAAELGK